MMAEQTTPERCPVCGEILKTWNGEWIHYCSPQNLVKHVGAGGNGGGRSTSTVSSQTTEYGWRPIETAPKDGRMILVYRHMPPWRVRGIAKWVEFRGIAGWLPYSVEEPPGVLGLSAPTHWAPFPEAPDTGDDHV